MTQRFIKKFFVLSTKQGALWGTLLLLSLFAACSSCELFQGPLYTFEVDSITPFTLDENTCLIPLLGTDTKPSRLVAINASNGLEKGRVVFKRFGNYLPMGQIAVVDQNIWISSMGIPYSNNEDTVLIVNPSQGQVVKKMVHDIYNSWELRYLPSSHKVMITSGTRYDEGAYSGTVPLAVFDTDSQSYQGLYYADSYTYSPMNLPDGSVWCSMAEDSLESPKWLGNFSLNDSTRHVDFTKVMHGYTVGNNSNDALSCGIANDGTLLVIGSKDIENSSDYELYFNMIGDYGKGSTQTIVARQSGVYVTYFAFSVTVYDSVSNRFFIMCDHYDETNANYIVVVDQAADGSWFINHSLTIYGNYESTYNFRMYAVQGMLVIERSNTHDKAVLELRSTSDPLTLIKTVTIE